MMRVMRRRRMCGTRDPETHGDSSSGAIGYFLRAKLLSRYFWTLSVWENERALDGFRGHGAAWRGDEGSRSAPERDEIYPMENPGFGHSPIGTIPPGASDRES